MSISDKLNFQPVRNTFSHQVCCYNCGRQGVPDNWLIAKIFPFDDKTDLNFIVCSEQCRQSLVSHQQLDIQIMLDVVKAAEQHSKTLSPDFKKILLLISN